MSILLPGGDMIVPNAPREYDSKAYIPGVLLSQMGMNMKFNDQFLEAEAASLTIPRKPDASNASVAILGKRLMVEVNNSTFNGVRNPKAFQVVMPVIRMPIGAMPQSGVIATFMDKAGVASRLGRHVIGPTPEYAMKMSTVRGQRFGVSYNMSLELVPEDIMRAEADIKRKIASCSKMMDAYLFGIIGGTLLTSETIVDRKNELLKHGPQRNEYSSSMYEIALARMDLAGCLNDPVNGTSRFKRALDTISRATRFRPNILLMTEDMENHFKTFFSEKRSAIDKITFPLVSLTEYQSELISKARGDIEVDFVEPLNAGIISIPRSIGEYGDRAPYSGGVPEQWALKFRFKELVACDSWRRYSIKQMHRNNPYRTKALLPSIKIPNHDANAWAEVRWMEAMSLGFKNMGLPDELPGDFDSFIRDLSNKHTPDKDHATGLSPAEWILEHKNTDTDQYNMYAEKFLGTTNKKQIRTAMFLGPGSCISYVVDCIRKLKTQFKPGDIPDSAYRVQLNSNRRTQEDALREQYNLAVSSIVNSLDDDSVDTLMGMMIHGGFGLFHGLNSAKKTGLDKIVNDGITDDFDENMFKRIFSRMGYDVGQFDFSQIKANKTTSTIREALDELRKDNGQLQRDLSAMKSELTTRLDDQIRQVTENVERSSRDMETKVTSLEAKVTASIAEAKGDSKKLGNRIASFEKDLQRTVQDFGSEVTKVYQGLASIESRRGDSAAVIRSHVRQNTESYLSFVTAVSKTLEEQIDKMVQNEADDTKRAALSTILADFKTTKDDIEKSIDKTFAVLDQDSKSNRSDSSKAVVDFLSRASTSPRNAKSYIAEEGDRVENKSNGTIETLLGGGTAPASAGASREEGSGLSQQSLSDMKNENNPIVHDFAIKRANPYLPKQRKFELFGNVEHTGLQESINRFAARNSMPIPNFGSSDITGALLNLGTNYSDGSFPEDFQGLCDNFEAAASISDTDSRNYVVAYSAFITECALINAANIADFHSHNPAATTKRGVKKEDVIKVISGENATKSVIDTIYDFLYDRYLTICEGVGNDHGLATTLFMEYVFSCVRTFPFADSTYSHFSFEEFNSVPSIGLAQTYFSEQFGEDSGFVDGGFITGIAKRTRNYILKMAESDMIKGKASNAVISELGKEIARNIAKKNEKESAPATIGQYLTLIREFKVKDSNLTPALHSYVSKNLVDKICEYEAVSACSRYALKDHNLTLSNNTGTSEISSLLIPFLKDSAKLRDVAKLTTIPTVSLFASMVKNAVDPVLRDFLVPFVNSTRTGSMNSSLVFLASNKQIVFNGPQIVASRMELMCSTPTHDVLDMYDRSADSFYFRVAGISDIFQGKELNIEPSTGGGLSGNTTLFASFSSTSGRQTRRRGGSARHSDTKKVYVLDPRVHRKVSSSSSGGGTGARGFSGLGAEHTGGYESNQRVTRDAMEAFLRHLVDDDATTSFDIGELFAFLAATTDTPNAYSLSVHGAKNTIDRFGWIPPFDFNVLWWNVYTAQSVIAAFRGNSVDGIAGFLILSDTVYDGAKINTRLAGVNMYAEAMGVIMHPEFLTVMDDVRFVSCRIGAPSFGTFRQFSSGLKIMMNNFNGRITERNIATAVENCGTIFPVLVGTRRSSYITINGIFSNDVTLSAREKLIGINPLGPSVCSKSMMSSYDSVYNNAFKSLSGERDMVEQNAALQGGRFRNVPTFGTRGTKLLDAFAGRSIACVSVINNVSDSCQYVEQTTELTDCLRESGGPLAFMYNS